MTKNEITIIRIGNIIEGVITLFFIGTLLYVGWQWSQDTRISPYEKNYKACLTWQAKCFAGIVVDRYKDKWDVYVLSSGAEFQQFRCFELYLDSVNVGDSIYKPANSFDIYHYKQANPDSVRYLKNECDCKSMLQEPDRSKFKVNAY